MSAVQPAPGGAPSKRFNVVISGAIRPGFELDQVRKSLAQLARIDLKKAAELLNGTPRVLKSNVDQSTATQFQLKFEAIGMQCAVKPVTPTVAAPAQVATAKTAVTSSDALTTQSLHAAFSGDVPKHAITPRYRAGIAAVAVLMVLLPVVYVGLVLALGYASIWHAVNDINWLGRKPGYLWLVAYAGLALGGLVAAVFLLKPLFAPARQSGWPIKLTRQEDALFFAFVDHIAERVGAPTPVEIHIDCKVNASASAKGGLLGLMRDELVLTVGLPLIGGLNARQLAAIVAHELGHFSQSAGMRFGYIVESTNHWLARCAYERDAWDEKLDAMHEQYNDVRGTLLLFAKGAVWLSRKCLSGAVYAGVLTSRFMSRQMEFDADRYAAEIAGSATEQEIQARFAELEAATEVVYRRLSYSWDDAKLSDNFPMMIVGESKKLPERYRESIAEALAQEKPSIWSTHPTPHERIAHVMALNAPGVFRSEQPGTALLPRFDRLCKQASLFHYRHVFGLAVTAEQLVSTAVVTAQADQGEADEEHLKNYLANQFSKIRYITIKRQAAFAVPDPKETKNRIDGVIQNLRTQLPEYEAALAKYTDAYDRRIRAFAARSLADNKVAFDAHALRMSGATMEDADAALVKATQEMTELEAALKRFETAMGQRMELAFGTRLDSATQNSLNQLVHVLATLAKTQEPLIQFHCYAIAARALNRDGNELADTSWDQYARYCTAEYEKILGLFGTTPYPFARADGVQTVSDYLRKQCGPAEQLAGDPATFAERTGAVLNSADYLHYRVVARLSAIAAGAEDALGVIPLQNARPQASTAAQTDPDAPDDKLPF
jgi:Zn-dependent protease with chaperone function